MRSKKAVENIIVSLLLQLITIICGFIVPKMIIQSFGSNVNGLISSITQFLGYITLLESGFGPVVKAALYKPIAEKDNKQISNILKTSEKFFKTIAYIFIAYLVILCLVYPLIMKQQLDTMFTISLVLIISISTFAEYYFGMTYRLYLQAEQETYIVSGIQIITTIINTIMVVLLIKVGASIQIVKLISAFVFVFRPILQNLYVKKKYKINLNESSDNYKLEQKWDGLAQHIASVVHNNTDIAVLTFFSTMEEVSVYSIYVLIINGVKKIVESFTGGIDALFGNMIANNEKENLNKKFSIYETFYFTLITIIFICAFSLIVPFVRVYTYGIKDANYIRPLFGFFIVLAEFIHAIRLPYNSLVLSSGHFKETRKGAWVEASTNIILSIIWVFKFGLIGVAIGTVIAMLIRTIEFMIHTSKYILNRNLSYNIRRMAIIILEVVVALIVNKILLSKYEIFSYTTWFTYAMITGCIALIDVLIINFIVYKKDFFEILNIIKNMNKK